MTDEQKLPDVIIAEDEPASRVLLKRQLERAGYRVHAFEDGRGALEAIQSAGSALVIADWMMPEMDGIQLCRAVRAQADEGALGVVHFVLLTAHTEKQQIVEGLEAGADDYLTKPYHERELLARLRAGARILHLQEELRQRQLELNKYNAELATLNRKFERLANEDALTGLANRRALLDRVHLLWQQAERNSQPIACIMMDVDRFKSVNDTYGHQAGDAVLREVARVMRGQVRGYDACGRFGGEEFCVMALGLDEAPAAALAERIRAAVEATVIRSEAHTIRVTLSAGVVSGPTRGTTAEQAMNGADEMLYAAKQNGRNQVWLRPGAGAPRRHSPAAAVTA